MLPTEDFKKEDLIAYWRAYVDALDKKGEKIVASILNIEELVVEGTIIHIELPNETMKIDLERAQHALLANLRKRLSNYDISIQSTVNEEIQKKYIFSAQDTYEKFKELNPAIELLRQEFNLDIKN